MRQEAVDQPCPLPRPVRQDLRDLAAVVIPETGQRHPAEGGNGVKGPSIHKRCGR
jgi:hypothetical protein